MFNTTNFERQGNSEKDIQLEDNEQTREAIIEISETALRSIKIFTPDLEHRLYDNELFIKNLLNFVRGNRHAQIQILVSDTSHSIRYGHRLLRLAQKLTSAMKIKITPEEYRIARISFLQVDQTDFIFKHDYSKKIAIQSSCKSRNIKLHELFNPAWEQAEDALNSKTLNL